MSRPNILIVIADGMQADTVNADHACLTPNIQALAGRGLHFHNAHTTCPTCSPARASLMTGLLPHNHGVLEVEHGRDDDQCVLRTEYPHFAQRLSAAGYQTGYFGKWHVERTQEVAPFGWQQSAVKGAEHLIANDHPVIVAEHQTQVQLEAVKELLRPWNYKLDDRRYEPHNWTRIWIPQTLFNQ